MMEGCTVWSDEVPSRVFDGRIPHEHHWVRVGCHGRGNLYSDSTIACSMDYVDTFHDRLAELPVERREAGIRILMSIPEDQLWEFFSEAGRADTLWESWSWWRNHPQWQRIFRPPPDMEAVTAARGCLRW